MLVVALLLRPMWLGAQDPGASGAAVSWRFSLKGSALLARPPEGAAGAAEGTSAAGFTRLRIEPTIRFDAPVVIDLALEQWVYVRSSSSAWGPAFVPANTEAPYRLAGLEWRLVSGDTGEWRAEIDRAAVRLHLPRADVTAGRQAIGWGRGALFGAVDLFAPFTPLAVDREWRRGVDAIRADVKLSDRISLDTVAAAETTGPSTLATRLRGYTKRLDLEILGGSRAGEPFAGAAGSAAIRDAELHGEFAVFKTGSGAIPKAVAGGSYLIPFAKGLFVHGEYHYSGFGASTPGALASLVRDPAFLVRYLRGDTQILGRHALAVRGSYEQSPALSTTAQWLHSPVDGSGVLIGSITYTIDDRWSLLVTGYAPYAGESVGGIRGEFGTSPFALFTQVRLYR